MKKGPQFDWGRENLYFLNGKETVFRRKSGFLFLLSNTPAGIQPPAGAVGYNARFMRKKPSIRAVPR